MKIKPKWQRLLGKLTWYWGIHHRLLPASSESDPVRVVWFSFLAGSCIFFCLELLLLLVWFVPPTCWRIEETEGQEKGKEIMKSVYFHVTTHVQKPTEVHRLPKYSSTSERKWRKFKNNKKLTSTKFPEYTSSNVTSRSRTMSLPLGISLPAGCLFPPNINPKSPKKLERRKKKHFINAATQRWKQCFCFKQACF